MDGFFKRMLDNLEMPGHWSLTHSCPWKGSQIQVTISVGVAISETAMPCQADFS